MRATPHAVRSRVRVSDLAAFAAIGGAATACHFSVVAGLVPRGVPALAANVAAFLAAFSVSFVGHGRWSFPGTGRRVGTALRRFAAVAVGGFVLNETLYGLLLRWTGLDYRLALVAVLAFVAGLTWMAGRYWVFAAT